MFDFFIRKKLSSINRGTLLCYHVFKCYHLHINAFVYLHGTNLISKSLRSNSFHRHCMDSPKLAYEHTVIIVITILSLAQVDNKARRMCLAAFLVFKSPLRNTKGNIICIFHFGEGWGGE